MSMYQAERKRCIRVTFGKQERNLLLVPMDDDIVPVDTAIRFARPRKASLHLIDDGHRLNDSLDVLGNLLAALLRRCASE
jgi:hypothetical protein